MVENKLQEKLNRLGLPLMEVTEDFDVNQTLVEVVKSNDSRLWEGFPVLLANAAQEFYFDYKLVKNALDTKQEQENFHALFLLSLALYLYHHLSFHWANQFKKELSHQDAALIKEMRNSIAHDAHVEIGGKQFHPSRLKQMFQNYFEQSAKKTRQLKEKHEELALKYALSQLFSAKQKELFKKKLEGMPLTKTEKEYYSRTVKKKVAALANPELHRLAQKLMDY